MADNINDIILIDDRGDSSQFTKTIEYPELAQGPAILISSGDTDIETSFTNPDLHRRIKHDQIQSGTNEVAPRKYELTVQGVDSYRSEEIIYHIDYQDITAEFLMDKYGYTQDEAEAYLETLKANVASQEELEIP